jgi:16S rRNA (guanine966-N2)-methyltransferase
MRVIAGTYRSRLLQAPPGRTVRPTSDRLRERLFNILAPRLPRARVADLFAGTGAIGIEAISRGAAFVLFCEKAPEALDIIQQNVRSLGIRTGFLVAGSSVVATLRKATEPFDIVFLDPPYEQAADYGETLRLLAQSADTLLAPDAIVVAEHQSGRRNKLLPRVDRVPSPVVDSYGKLRRYRLIEQGEAALSFFRIEADVETETAEGTKAVSETEDL